MYWDSKLVRKSVAFFSIYVNWSNKTNFQRFEILSTPKSAINSNKRKHIWLRDLATQVLFALSTLSPCYKTLTNTLCSPVPSCIPQRQPRHQGDAHLGEPKTDFGCLARHKSLQRSITLLVWMGNGHQAREHVFHVRLQLW